MLGVRHDQIKAVAGLAKSRLSLVKGRSVWNLVPDVSTLHSSQQIAEPSRLLSLALPLTIKNTFEVIRGR